MYCIVTINITPEILYLNHLKMFQSVFFEFVLNTNFSAFTFAAILLVSSRRDSL